MKSEEVKKYYRILEKKRSYLLLKRVFDLLASIILTIILLPIMIAICIIIKTTSPGKIFFLQERVTKDGKKFKIFKFRTMKENSEKLSGVTLENDSRITKCGKWLRKLRLDELPQVFNLLKGELSLVGVRPESVKYVEKYSPEMKATLLMPAGITSETSILYKDESKLLKNSVNPDEVYVNEILPQKMKHNLEYIEKCNLWYDIKVIFKTVIAVIKK